MHEFDSLDKLLHDSGNCFSGYSFFYFIFNAWIHSFHVSLENIFVSSQLTYQIDTALITETAIQFCNVWMLKVELDFNLTEDILFNIQSPHFLFGEYLQSADKSSFDFNNFKNTAIGPLAYLIYEDKTIHW